MVDLLMFVFMLMYYILMFYTLHFYVLLTVFFTHPFFFTYMYEHCWKEPEIQKSHCQQLLPVIVLYVTIKELELLICSLTNHAHFFCNLIKQIKCFFFVSSHPY